MYYESPTEKKCLFEKCERGITHTMRIRTYLIHKTTSFSKRSNLCICCVIEFSTAKNRSEIELLVVTVEYNSNKHKYLLLCRSLCSQS